jgi:hypothetical protein
MRGFFIKNSRANPDLRQLGYLLFGKRPVAFRPHLAVGLALSDYSIYNCKNKECQV